MSRPETELDYKIVDTALFYGATLEQVQFLLRQKGQSITTKTIQRCIERDKGVGFKEYREQQFIGCKYSLKQKAIKKAMNGDNTMLIFCLKNLLGWADKVDQNLSTDISINIDKEDEKL